MTVIRPAIGTPGVVQGIAVAATAAIAAHTLDQAASINGAAVFVLACLAAVAVYLAVGLLAAIAGRS